MVQSFFCRDCHRIGPLGQLGVTMSMGIYMCPLFMSTFCVDWGRASIVRGLVFWIGSDPPPPQWANSGGEVSITSIKSFNSANTHPTTQKILPPTTHLPPSTTKPLPKPQKKKPAMELSWLLEGLESSYLCQNGEEFNFHSTGEHYRVFFCSFAAILALRTPSWVPWGQSYIF